MARRTKRSRGGMTLVELMIGTALLVGGGGALLLGMHYALMHSDYLNDFQIVMTAVQSRMEDIASQPFGTLIDSVGPYAAAQTAAGQCMGLDEDLNCSGQLDAGEDADGDGVLDEPIPRARLSVRIEKFPPGSTDPTLATVHVAACWFARGRIIGEDLNCNGVLDNGEDANANGWLDSPAMASTRVADNQ